MRWLHTEPQAVAENAQRDAQRARIDEWWRAFESKTDELGALFRCESEWDLAAWMAETLQAIDHRLMWEYGPPVHGEGHRLVITPEAETQLRPLVAEIIKRAPRIPGWEIYGYRQHNDGKWMDVSVKGRTGESTLGWTVRVQPGNHNRFDLTFFVPRLSDDNHDEFETVAFVAAEEALGERCLERWIGLIQLKPPPRLGGLLGLFSKTGKSNAIPLTDLRRVIDEQVTSLRASLPETPYYRVIDECPWALLKSKPRNAVDFVDQTDVFIARNVNPDLWIATRSSRFYSERFTRVGESYCYIKLDHADLAEGDEVEFKDVIEEQINAALIPESLGCSIGGGTGLRYVYIELALTDVDSALRIVREQLQAADVPHRSWILFHAEDLAAEWVGIYPDSPPPRGFDDV